jgi:hypothetical protein
MYLIDTARLSCTLVLCTRPPDTFRPVEIALFMNTTRCEFLLLNVCTDVKHFDKICYLCLHKFIPVNILCKRWYLNSSF